MNNGRASDNFLIFIIHTAPLERKNEKPTMIRTVEAATDQLPESRIAQISRILRYSLSEIDLGSGQFSRELNISEK